MEEHYTSKMRSRHLLRGLEKLQHMYIPQLAQPRRTPRPISEGEALVGRAFAAEEANIHPIMIDIETAIQPRSPIWWTPREARVWRQAEAIQLPPSEQVRCLHPLDIRQGVWERYHAVRCVPIIRRGRVMGTVVASMETTMHSLQQPLHLTATADHVWRLLALSPEEWCILAEHLPADIREDLSELEFLRGQMRKMEGNVERGGMYNTYQWLSPQNHIQARKCPGDCHAISTRTRKGSSCGHGMLSGRRLRL